MSNLLIDTLFEAARLDIFGVIEAPVLHVQVVFKEKKVGMNVTLSILIPVRVLYAFDVKMYGKVM